MMLAKYCFNLTRSMPYILHTIKETINDPLLNYLNLERILNS